MVAMILPFFVSFLDNNSLISFFSNERRPSVPKGIPHCVFMQFDTFGAND